MTARAKTLGGPKIGGRHTTITRAADRLIVLLKSRPDVERIIPAECARVAPGRFAVRTQDAPGGLRIAVKESGALQRLFVATHAPDAVRSFLAALRAEDLK